jgi:plastocyanin
LLVTTFAATALLGACTGGAAAPASGGVQGSVIAQDLAFVPASISVPVGGSISFSNRDDVAHTVTEGTNGQAVANATFDEELEGTADARVVVSFPTAGVVSITCRFHPSMALAVTVGEAAPAASPAGSPAASPSAYTRDY